MERLSLNSLSPSVFTVRSNETADGSKARADIISMGRLLAYENARRGKAHQHRGDAHAGENGRQSQLHAHVQHVCHQCARPRAGARQRDAHQNDEADGAVFVHRFALGKGTALQPANEGPHPGKAAQPEEHRPQQP